MIETHLRKQYQKICIEPLLGLKIFRSVHPIVFTSMACLIGVGILPLLAYHHSFLALCFLCISGFLDTFDGSLARYDEKTSPKGAALDIISDRIVELSVILGLFFVDPSSRALPALFMLGSVLICVTSFLIVGIFTENHSTKSFHYSPGLIERAEAFLFFAVMIAFPPLFFSSSILFSALVFLTGMIRMIQFLYKK